MGQVKDYSYMKTHLKTVVRQLGIVIKIQLQKSDETTFCCFISKQL